MLALVLGAWIETLPAREPPLCQLGEVAVYTDFAGAAVDGCNSDGTLTLTIEPEDQGQINDSPWYAFQLIPTAGTAAQITTVVLRYQGGHHRYWPKVSIDGADWTRLDADQVAVSDDRVTATLTLGPISQPLWVAAQELVTVDRMTQWYQELATRAGVEMIVLGQSVGGRPIHYLDINPSAEDLVLLVGRQHPPEVTGSLAMRQFVAALLGDGKAARSFRQRYRIIIAPLLNPDGVSAGHWRHNLQGTDLNRDWGDFAQPETQLIKTLIDELVAANVKLRLFLDFHSTRRNVFYTQGDDDPTWPPRFAEQWLDAAGARIDLEAYPFENAKRPTTEQQTSKNYIHSRFGIPAITYEIGDETDRAALATATPVFADEMMRLMIRTAELDVLIVNGLVYDGSTAAPRHTNLAIQGRHIVAVDVDPATPARRTIDANGLIVVPGFIDPHTHALSDLKDPSRSANLNYLTQGVTTVFVGNDGDGVKQRATTLAQLASQGIGPNLGFFAGHGLIRETAIGRAERAPTETELVAMQQLVAAEMQAGALGLSSGLYYAPGSYAQTGEVVALATQAANYDGVYDTHIRDESTYSIGLLAAINEAIEVGSQARIPVHISHIKALGKAVWGQSGEIIDAINAARDAGVVVTANQYPWRASGTRFSSALVPRWVMADSRDAMRERLSDPGLLPRIRGEMTEALERRGGPAAMLITSEHAQRGNTLAEAAQALGLDAVDAAIALVLDGDPSIASFIMDPADIQALAVQPWVMTGSDGSRGHPRKYATYPQAYQSLVVEQGLLSMAQLVHRSSGMVADSFGLCDRGYLQPGRHADIALIDPDQYRPRANYEMPEQLTEGVRYLLINGSLVIDDARFTRELPGTVINKQALTCATESLADG